MQINKGLDYSDLANAACDILQLGASKSKRRDRSWNPADGSPVFTVGGRYATRGWTEWTQGFQYGCLILSGEATQNDSLIQLGKSRTIENMLPHVTHIGVHDHGFNNLSTYGNLLRLMDEGRIAENEWERTTYANAIAVSDMSNP